MHAGIPLGGQGTLGTAVSFRGTDVAKYLHEFVRKSHLRAMQPSMDITIRTATANFDEIPRDFITSVQAKTSAGFQPALGNVYAFLEDSSSQRLLLRLQMDKFENSTCIITGKTVNEVQDFPEQVVRALRQATKEGKRMVVVLDMNLDYEVVE